MAEITKDQLQDFDSFMLDGGDTISAEALYQIFKERMIQEIGVTSIIQSTHARGQHIKSELTDKVGDNHEQ